MFALLIALSPALAEEPAPSAPADPAAAPSADPLAVLDQEIAALKTELDEMAKAAAAPRRSPAELAELEVHHAEALLDPVENDLQEARKAIPVAKERGNKADITGAKRHLAEVKAEHAKRLADLKAKQAVWRAAVKAGEPAPAPTPEEAAAEKRALELAARRLELLKARRAHAAAGVALEQAKAAGTTDLASLEAEVAAKQTEVTRLETELATAEAR